MNWVNDKEKIHSIGIIGAGYVAGVHSKVLKAIDPFIEQVIFDVNAETAQKFSGEYGCQIAETLDVLLDSVDAVIIATPVWTHYNLVLEALNRQKHVLCEKPMAQHLHEAKEMCSMYENANLICAIGFNYRFFDITGCLLNEIANEPIQEIHLSIRRLFRNDWKRDETSVLSDLGIHLLDLLTFFSGGLIDTTRCDIVMKYINTCDYDSVVKGYTDNDVFFVLEAARIDNPQDVCFDIQIKYNNKILQYDSRTMWIYKIFGGNEICEKNISRCTGRSDFFDFYDSILRQDKEWLMAIHGQNSNVLASFRDGYLSQINLNRLLNLADTRFKMKKIFIGCPITKYIEEGTFTDEEFKCFIEKLYTLCSCYADEVFLALKREQYGKKLMRDTCTKLDYQEMKTTDLFIAIPEDSKGTAVELGWASVLKKKIILILNKDNRYTPLISGLGDITDTFVVWYNKTLDDRVINNVSNAIDIMSKGI